MRYPLIAQALAAAGMLTCAAGGQAAETIASTTEPATAQPPPFSQIETAARANAGNVRASQAERTAARARREVAESQSNVRVFGGAGINDAHEAVTDTYVRNYRRATATVGIRWNLLANRLSQKRDAKQAEWDEARARLREEIAGNDAVYQVRVAAVRAAYAEERATLAKAFLALRAQVQSQLQARHAAGTMLGAEAQELSSLNEAAQLQLDRQTQLHEDAVQTIRRITALQGNLQLSTPAWPDTCFSPTRLMQEDGRGAQSEQELNAQAAASQMRLLEGGILDSMEAGVQVTHSRMTDSPGSPGRNSGVHVDFAVPLGWKQVRDARINEWSAKRQQAEVLLQQEQSLRQFDIDKGLRSRAMLKSEIANAQSLMNARMEALRVSNLRRPALEDEGISAPFKARHALFEASMKVVDTQEKYSLAEAALLALGPECPTGEQPPSGHLATPPLLSALGGTKVAADSSAASAEAAADKPRNASSLLPDARRPAATVPLSTLDHRIGWYVWDGIQLLKNPEQLERLPASTGRLLLSFSADQLQGQRVQDWQALRQRASKQNIRLELLLGDPSWVTADGRAQLLELLSGLSELPVDGLNLDLEHSQLPPGTLDQERWKRETTATIRAVHAAVPWELSLTTHHRDLDDSAFLAALRSSGLTEIVPMIYTQNAARAIQLTERLLAHSSGLYVGLAQSIERELSKDESSFHEGRSKSLQRWTALSDALSRKPLFSGVIVQSMAEYQEAKP